MLLHIKGRKSMKALTYIDHNHFALQGKPDSVIKAAITAD